MPFVVRWKSLLLCAALLGPWVAWAEPPIPRPAASAGAGTGAASAPERPHYAPLIRMQCSPVTPDTKVPWIEVSQLPDLTKDYSYFEACSDLDTAWTSQSYPDPKFVPPRTPEHEERVARFLQGVKDFVAADVDDWVGYVNGWLGTTLPTAQKQYKQFPDGLQTTRLNSSGADLSLRQFNSHAKIIGLHLWRDTETSGVLTERRSVSILAISSDSDCVSLPWRSEAYRTQCNSGTPKERLCITPVDIQKSFPRPGYVLLPMSVRTARERPNAQQVAELGGQWFGYKVHVFEAGQSVGTIGFGFGFMPCAARVDIDLKKTRPKSEAQPKEKP